DVGDHDQTCRARLSLSVQLLAWNVRPARGGRPFQRHGGTATEGRSMDGVGEAAVCARHDWCCRILFDTDGATALLMAPVTGRIECVNCGVTEIQPKVPG